MSRTTVLLGSLPGADAEAAMTDALDRTGGAVKWLPDGETGDRFRWIARVIDTFRDNPDLEVSRDGDQTSYDRALNFRVRRKHRFDGHSLRLGYVDSYRESRPIFDRLRAERKRPDLVFQVGMPTDLTFALLSMGPTGIRHRAAFRNALIREIGHIRAEAGDDVLFLLEAPADAIMCVRAAMGGAPTTAMAARWVASGFRRLVAGTPAGTRFGVHLCVGDLGHHAMVQPKSAAPFVAAANAIGAAWPPGRKLEFLHLPLGAGDQAPPLEPDFYGPLSRLRLPVGTRFAAGFLHEDHSVEDHLRIRSIVDTLVGHPVDVAAACGLGRRPVDAAHATLDAARALTTT